VLVTQDGKDTLIGFQTETLAILKNITASSITESAFVPIA